MWDSQWPYRVLVVIGVAGFLIGLLGMIKGSLAKRSPLFALLVTVIGAIIVFVAMLGNFQVNDDATNRDFRVHQLSAIQRDARQRFPDITVDDVRLTGFYPRAYIHTADGCRFDVKLQQNARTKRWQIVANSANTRGSLYVITYVDGSPVQHSCEVDPTAS